MKKKVTKLYSISHIVSLLLLFVFLLTFITALLANLHAVNSVRDKTASGLLESLETYSSGLSANVTSIENYLTGKDTGTSSENMRTLEYGSPTSTQYYQAVSLEQAELSSMLTTQDILSGLFVFPAENREFLYAAWVKSSPVIESLETLLLQSALDDTLGQLTSRGWFLHKAGEGYYLVRVLKVSQSYVGAWLDFSRILSFMGGEGSLVEEVLYRDPEGVCYNGTSTPSSLQPSQGEESDPYTMFSQDGKLYMAISYSADYLQQGASLVLAVPDRMLSFSLTQNYAILLLSTLVILLAGLAAFLVLRAFIVRPLGILRSSIDDLRRGDFTTRVNSSTRLAEIAQVNSAFNEMVGQIQSYKIAVYEERLERQKLEIQFLKTQLAPHFLINCLNLIFHLSRQGENSKVQKMTIGLGSHLRYVLADQRSVSLQKETDMVRNYIDLSALRYPNCIALYMDIQPQAREALVLPMSLVCLAENTVKHCVEPGRMIEFHVEAQVLGEEDKKYLALTFWDTGDGFSDKTLTELNSPFRPSLESGQHIGIKNTIQRMELAYGSRFSIYFSNRPGAGAQIEFRLPYWLRWMEDEEEDS